MLKKILIILIIVLIGVQFIRPSKNLTTEPQPNSADHLFPMSENLMSGLPQQQYPISLV
ncbi:MAG TPA: hypothetical protein PLS00_11555 [Niabella sp.]|nr:hypothetical protein [Niabella sp.]